MTKELSMYNAFFKAKAIKSKKPHEGLLVFTNNEICHIQDKHGEIWVCDFHSLSRCTGEKDKNGYYIYEGDEVVCHDYAARKGTIRFGKHSQYQSDIDMANYDNGYLGFYIEWVEGLNLRQDFYFWYGNNGMEILRED
ncbi:MAG: hypothetical protein GX903_11920 [Spirochaetales bacterium]|nr:hypothetical protein [Spirochaetales bacterium]